MNIATLVTMVEISGTRQQLERLRDMLNIAIRDGEAHDDDPSGSEYPSYYHVYRQDATDA